MPDRAAHPKGKKDFLKEAILDGLNLAANGQITHYTQLPNVRRKVVRRFSALTAMGDPNSSSGGQADHKTQSQFLLARRHYKACV